MQNWTLGQCQAVRDKLKSRRDQLETEIMVINSDLGTRKDAPSDWYSKAKGARSFKQREIEDIKVKLKDLNNRVREFHAIGGRDKRGREYRVLVKSLREKFGDTVTEDLLATVQRSMEEEAT